MLPEKDTKPEDGNIFSKILYVYLIDSWPPRSREGGCSGMDT